MKRSKIIQWKRNLKRKNSINQWRLQRGLQLQDYKNKNRASFNIICFKTFKAAMAAMKEDISANPSLRHQYGKINFKIINQK